MRGWLRRYGVAVLSGVAGLLGSLGALAWAPGGAAAIALAAVAVASWYGGSGPGLVALAIAGPGLVAARLGPRLSVPLELGTAEAVELALFLLAAALIVGLTGRLRAGLERARGELAGTAAAGVAAVPPGSPDEVAAPFERLPDPVAECDDEGRLLVANSALEELSGFSAAELRGLTMRALLGPAGGSTTDRAGFARTGFWRGGRELRTRAGGMIPIELTVRALPGPADEPARYVAFLRDVRGQAADERSQDDILAIVGHELKLPLTMILGWAELLAGAGASNQPAAAAIVTQSRRLTRLVNDLLDVRRIRAGPIELIRTPVDVRDLARAAADRAQAATRQHLLRVAVPDRPLVALLDHDRVQQILDNLLSNAIKYSPAGGEIRLELRAEDGQVVLEVRDPGLGIPPADLPRIFDRYFRSSETAATIPGLGLGLHIAQRLAEAHGGRIEASSALGRGSTFTLRLPIRPA